MTPYPASRLSLKAAIADDPNRPEGQTLTGDIGSQTEINKDK